MSNHSRPIAPDGLPKPPTTRGLVPFKKGQSGNPGGRSKSSLMLKTRFRDALSILPSDGRESIVDIVIAIARGDQPTERSISRMKGGAALKEVIRQNDKQMDAIKLILAYGIGLPAKRIDETEAKKIAEKMVDGMMERARQNLSEQRDGVPDSVQPIDVEVESVQKTETTGEGNDEETED